MGSSYQIENYEEQYHYRVARSPDIGISQEAQFGPSRGGPRPQSVGRGQGGSGQYYTNLFTGPDRFGYEATFPGGRARYTLGE